MSDTSLRDLADLIEKLCESIREIKFDLSGLVAHSDDSQRTWFTVAETAEQLGLAPWTVGQYCRCGKIYGKKIKNDREWRIPREEITRFQEEGARDTTASFEQIRAAAKLTRNANRPKKNW